jgi:hypothetical protein
VPSCTIGDGTAIVYAWAENNDPDNERAAERVYAGRLLKHEEMIARGPRDPHISPSLTSCCRSPAV